MATESQSGSTPGGPESDRPADPADGLRYQFVAPAVPDPVDPASEPGVVQAPIPENEAVGREAPSPVSEKDRSETPEHAGADGIVSGAIEAPDVEEAEPTSLVETRPSTILPVGCSTGRFVLLEEVWVRGFGDSCLAHDLRSGKRALVTFLFRRGDGLGGPERRARRQILDHVRRLTTLSHENVVAPYELDVMENWWFMATPYRDAITLQDWLGRKRRTWQDVVSVFVKAGQGLSALHAAGLVHAHIDVQAILIKADGAVRVDCRFARPSGEASEEVSWRDPSEPGPEPSEWDALADQQQFCVCLYECLHGHRIPDRPGQPPRPGDRIPPWLHAAVHRGMAEKPGQRWPKMEDLVASLEHGDQPGWVKGVLLAGLVSAGVAVGLGYGARVHQRVDNCMASAETQLALWNAERKTAIREAFLEAAPSYGADTWRRVEARLDDDIEALLRDYRKLCTGEEPAVKIYEPMGACLATRAAERRSAIQLLSRADAPLVRTAVRLIDDLPPLETCHRPWRGTRALVSLSATEHRDDADSVRVGLAQARVLGDAGLYREAIAIAEQLFQDAQSVPGASLTAEVSFRLGVLHLQSGSPAAAARWLAQAAWRAEASHLDELAADAQTLLVFVTGYALDDAEEARSWVPHAEAAVQRLGGDEARESRLAFHRGTMELRDGHPNEAVEHYGQALAHLERARLRSAIDQATIHGAMGMTFRSQAEFRQAEPHLRATLELLQRALGPLHPDVGTAHANLGLVLQDLGQFEEAEEQYRSASRILLADEKGSRRSIAAVRGYLGSLALRRGDRQTAEGWLRQAIDGLGSDPGRTDVARGMSLVLLGMAALEHADFEEALERFAEVERMVAEPTDSSDMALAAHVALGRGRAELLQNRLDSARRLATAALLQFETAVGPDKPPVAETLLFLGQLDRLEQQPGEASRRCERALIIRERIAGGDDHPDLIAPLVCLGRAQLELDDRESARATLGRAHGLAQSLPVHPAERGAAAFAWALVLEPDDRNQARQWGEAARVEFERAGAGFEREYAEVVRWEASNPAHDDP